MTETKNLATALAAFQSKVTSVAKGNTADAGQYSYKYADLADITRVAYPLLSEHGLSFSCCPRQTEKGSYELAGVLLHTSGERLEGALPLFGNSPQQLGSAITYARRYLLGAMTGIVTDEDDDGAAAQRSTQQQPRQQGQSNGKASESQLRQLSRVLDQAGMGGWGQEFPETGKQVAELLGRNIAGPSDLSSAEASKVIDWAKELANGGGR